LKGNEGLPPHDKKEARRGEKFRKTREKSLSEKPVKKKKGGVPTLPRSCVNEAGKGGSS